MIFLNVVSLKSLKKAYDKVFKSFWKAKKKLLLNIFRQQVKVFFVEMCSESKIIDRNSEIVMKNEIVSTT